MLRPWGPLPWLMSKLGDRSWSMLGVCGTEERCASALALVGPERREACRFLRIRDPEPGDNLAYGERLDAREAELKARAGGAAAICEVDLLADIDAIREQVSTFLDASGPNVLLDITSMPKWWFFPALRFLLAEPCRVDTLLVTYGSAASYAPHLASNTRALEALPTFEARDGRTEHQELIVGIGFAPLELADLYTELERVRYLFPFPPGPPSFERNWRFLQDLEERIGHDRQRDDRWHVNMYDAPSIFEALERFTDDGRRTSALAPFGPKTVSLAMCLFSIACEAAGRPSVPAFYTQPMRYALDYTKGVRLVDGLPDVRAYAVRLGGRPLYTLEG